MTGGARAAALVAASRDDCGKLRYGRRADAQAVKKRLRGQGAVSVYPCPLLPHGDGWHVGHEAPAVRNGTVTRAQAAAHRAAHRVIVHADFVGAPVTVTWPDPSAPARIVDALNAAADALERCAPKQSRKYRADADRLADALDRAAVPACNLP